LLDREALRRSFTRLRGDAAVGVDGVTKQDYERDLEKNLQQLHERMRTMRWRHQPIRRVHIPKSSGKTRPIGVSAVEDKVVQGAIAELLSAAYEPIFHDGSYGFRPGRSAHNALRKLNQAVWRERYLLEADIESFFDSIDRRKLQEMIWERIADKSIRRLVGKCLHVGILDGFEYSEPDEGTVQGSALSPLLGNVYLHHVLDVWFEREVKPRLKGRATLIRFADDFTLTFELRADAERVMAVLGKRFERFGLRLHPEKTRLVEFQPPDDPQGGKRESFSFLGFTHFWTRTRKGGWRPDMKTRKESLRKFIGKVTDWCRRHRHLPVRDQHQALCRRINGHYNYFAVNGNIRSLERVRYETERVWKKWLERRSQNGVMSWTRFREKIVRNFPLPSTRIRVQIWATS
jgi:group II intron reverse transcriptase/maturase